MRMNMDTSGNGAIRSTLDHFRADISVHGSPNIANAFGRPGPSDGEGLHIINFFIEQIQANFILWNADPDVLLQVCKRQRLRYAIGAYMQYF